MDNRILIAKFNNTDRFVFTDSLFQYDYGQELKIDGLELPDTFEVHFSKELHGNSTTSLYTDGTVVIPDIYLTTSGKLYAWIYLHDTEDDGETEYSIIIDIRPRAKITNATPTPVQQDIITQTIAALNEAVSETESNVTHYPKIEDDGYWYVWDAIANDWTNTNVKAQGEQGVQGEQGPKGADGADGKDGKDGVDGQDGTDGFSPIATVTKSGDTATISITDKNGTTTATVTDGNWQSVIDDTTTALDHTWSSTKISSDFGKYIQMKDVSGTLTAGSTTLTLSDASITTSSTIEVFCDVDGIAEPSKVVTAGSITLTFAEAQQSNMGVKVRVS